jgi:LysM repeat protein
MFYKYICRLILILISLNFNLIAQNISIEEYINKYKGIAIDEMKTYKIPASITLAQGIHESANGNSILPLKANNHFGVKCQDNWNGETFFKDDDKEDECFRKYNNPDESFKDHCEFIKNRKRYFFLFDLKTDDYKGWAKGLKAAGYATNPNYPELLVNIIEKYKLNEFDRENYRDNNIHKDTITKKKSKFKLLKSNKKEKSNYFGNKKVNRDIILRNNIKAIFANKGDSYESIAKEFDMYSWQILKYNDFSKTDSIRVGDIIYLQPKRNRAKEDYHIYQSGESLKSISQQYGIKLSALIKKNKLENNNAPETGQKLYLRKKKK